MNRHYEACKHRSRQTGLGNAREDFLYPCPICEADEKKQGGMGFPLFVIALAVAGILAWVLS